MASTIRTAAVLAALAVASPALADDALLEPPRPRQGYYVAFGPALTLGHIRETGDSLGTFVGSNFSLRLGQLLTRRLGLGLAIDFGSAKDSPQAATLFALGVAGQAEVACDLALHAGIGLGVATLDDLRDDDEVLRGAYGAAFTAGLTYDWFPWADGSGGWALTPGLWLRAIPGEDVDSFLALVSLEVSWWKGLPKDQLDLPPDQAYR